MKNIPLLVIGATVSGIAMALAMPNQVLVVEKTAMLGREFIDSMNAKRCQMEGDYSTMTLNFKDELLRRNLLSKNGNIHVSRVSSVLANHIVGSGAEILMLTEVVSIQACTNGFEVILFNANGFSTIFADRIIDTTSIGIFHQYAKEINIQKNLCAVLAYSGGKRFDLVSDEQAIVLQGRFENEYILKLKVKGRDTWPQARARMHDYWQHNRLYRYSGWKIAALASTFAYDFGEIGVGYYVKELHQHWHWMPSASYMNLLSAFEGGLHAML